MWRFFTSIGEGSINLPFKVGLSSLNTFKSWSYSKRYEGKLLSVRSFKNWHLYPWWTYFLCLLHILVTWSLHRLIKHQLITFYMGKKNSAAWVGVNSEAEAGGWLGKAVSLFLTAREGGEVGGNPASVSFIDPAWNKCKKSCLFEKLHPSLLFPPSAISWGVERNLIPSSCFWKFSSRSR